MIEHNQIIWMYNCIKAWGLLEFCRNRFNTFVENTKKYNPSLTHDENIDKIGRRPWGFCPGILPDANKDYFSDDLAGVPEKNRTRVKEAYEFVIKWCSPKSPKTQDNAEQKDDTNGEGNKAATEMEMEVPEEYQTAYEMKPWKDYPDRTYPY